MRDGKTVFYSDLIIKKKINRKQLLIDCGFFEIMAMQKKKEFDMITIMDRDWVESIAGCAVSDEYIVEFLKEFNDWEEITPKT